jgi:DNA-binding response OmpR family regulator
LLFLGFPRQRKEASLALETERKKIFVLGDEPEIQIFLCNLLSAQGFQPVIAESDSEAYQKVIDEDPDLIIIDLIQYRDSKTLLYRALKSDEKLKNIPIIMLSSIDRKTFFHYLKCKSSPSGGAMPEPDAFLIKPPEADELLQLVRALTKSGKSLKDEAEWV